MFSEGGTTLLIGSPHLGNTTGMGIGAGILLIVVGGILAFALDATLAGLDLKVVGWILMLAGVAGLILFFYFWNRRRAPTAVMTERVPAVTTEPAPAVISARAIVIPQRAPAVMTESPSYSNTDQAPATTSPPVGGSR